MKVDYRRDFCSPVHTTLLLVFFSVMLYKIYEELPQGDLKKIKFLLSDKLGRRPTEMCNVRTKPPFTSNMEKCCWIVFSFHLDPFKR